ncbi:hypothetical protein [uncultured Methanospirillum sp.]|uniref:hypothetical protein n=1 Tax=uncultured Methanospirillum sp. TaxID=262503 RepID=UPI0029C6B8DE|nr:hypothetical protein [uncultured Methanospirillum sp.]
MITQMAVNRTPIFRGIYYPNTLGQCPLHRRQMNCQSCDRYLLVRRLVYGGTV